MKLVILDRDGVINEDSSDFIKSPAEWHPLPGSLDAIARLTRAGYAIVVATNQSGVGRGLLDERTLQAIHRKMSDAVEEAGGHLTDIVYCPHRPGEDCACRKPRPGLFRQIAERYAVKLTGVPAIGDSTRDLDAARAVGARPILVLTGKGRATLTAVGRTVVEVYPDLSAAATQLVRESAGGAS
jgi:D-glycero-D-manno-heptose 1,7-bisphosphate phosphatase